jgi:hypothetical protein
MDGWLTRDDMLRPCWAPHVIESLRQLDRRRAHRARPPSAAKAAMPAITSGAELPPAVLTALAAADAGADPSGADVPGLAPDTAPAPLDAPGVACARDGLDVEALDGFFADGVGTVCMISSTDVALPAVQSTVPPLTTCHVVPVTRMTAAGYVSVNCGLPGDP